MKAFLILEDGTIYEGISIGSTREMISEIVFNTSMTGYLEVLTDPSYAGQAVVMTYPLIGNYGVTPDTESRKSWVNGYIVQELSRMPSNFRCEGSIQDYLIEQDIPGIADIDTRALTKRLREKGTMNGMITTNEGFSLEEVLQELHNYTIGNAVAQVTCQEKQTFSGNGGYKVALLNLGTKNNMINSLISRGCEVTVYPAHTTAAEIISDHPDGIVLSNGPGNPETYASVTQQIRTLSQSNIPVFAVGLGHQLMALAFGGRIKRLKHGHRGGNYPVRDMTTGQVFITAQNHGYVVAENSMDAAVAVPAYQNINDGSNEGYQYQNKHIFTVQFHPEACPAQLDAGNLYDRFIRMMKGE